MLRLLKVTGNSLTPDYQEGDFVLVGKIPFFFAAPRPGQVIAFHQPGYGLLIKRVERVNDEGLIVTGTRLESIDSRTFGEVRPSDVIGKVIWHIRKPRG